MTKLGECFEQLDHADINMVILGMARGLVLECSVTFRFHFFVLLFSHQIIVKQLLSVQFHFVECHIALN